MNSLEKIHTSNVKRLQALKMADDSIYYGLTEKDFDVKPPSLGEALELLRWIADRIKQCKYADMGRVRTDPVFVYNGDEWSCGISYDIYDSEEQEKVRYNQWCITPTGHRETDTPLESVSVTIDKAVERFPELLE